MNACAINDAEFMQLQRFIHDAAGISLAPSKKPMVSVRLSSRLRSRGIRTFAEYVRLLNGGSAPEEVQTAIDLLTTNETYFFREPKHFEFLRSELTARAARGHAFRAWSAASSTGEEAYSIAMLLEDCMPGQNWEVFGSDISKRVLECAKRGHYPLSRIDLMPAGYLHRFCLRGHGPQSGTLLIDRSLRERVQFSHINLHTPLPAVGMFDVIFLRNVLIYFNATTKHEVVNRVIAALRPGGCFIVGHCETIAGIDTPLDCLSPSIYRKKANGR